jgi:hypothetical protein
MSKGLSLRELCAEIEIIVGKPASFEVLLGEPSDVVGDISMMKSNLHTPLVQLSAGLKDLI